MYNGSYSFREFIIKFNGHINNLPNLKDVTHSAKHILQSFLTGHALNAYKSLPIDVRKGEWKNLLEELSLVIHGPEVQQEAKIILPSLRQDCDTVEIFAKKVENITFMAYPGKSNATTYKSTLKTIFMNGLNEDIRIHVLRDVPESFEAALKKAKLEESLRRIEKKEEETAKYDPMASTEEYTNVGTTRLGKPNLNTNFLFISFVILTMATYASAEKSWIPLKPHIFYDCEKPHGEVLIEVPPFGECSFEREPMRVRKGTVTVHIKKERSERVEAFKCKIEVYKKCFSNSWSFLDTVTYTPLQFIRPDEDECRRVQREQVWKKSSSNLQSSSSSSLHRFADQVRILTKMSFSYVNTARKIEITLLVMCFFWTMTSAWHPVEPVDFYDCTNPTGHVLVELPPPANCSRKSEPKKLLTGKVTVHIRNESTDNIEAFKCTIRLQKKCVKNFLFFFNTPRFEFLRYLKPSSKECQKVRTEHTWSNLQLREVKKGIMISDPEERPLAVPFNGEACQTVKSFILHQGYVRGLNDGTMASDLIDTPNCNIKQRQCEAETAIVQWDTIPQRPLCDFITMGTFSAQIADGTLLIEEEQTAFPLDKTFNPPEHKNCFEKKAFSSNGYVYLTFKEDSQQDSDVRVAETKNEELATWTRMRRNTAVEENDNEKEDEDEWNRRDDEIAVNAEKKITDEKTARNYRLETLSVNGRLNYLSHKTEETLRKNFGATLLSICNMRNEKIREWKTMMGFSVTQSVRNFLNRKDIEAVGVGKDLVRVSQCVTETVTHIDLTKNYDEEPGKYEELQRVKTKSGRIAFVAAGNNYIIRNKQNHISCDEITPHYWKNLNGYWELDGAVVDVDFKSPPIETPTFQNMKLVFSTVDIFASGHVSTFPVAFAISAKADIRALEYQQRENAKKGSSYLSKIVASFPAVFNKVADAYVEFFNKVTSTYINWLPFGISTSGAVAVIIIAFVIWYQCRKAKVIAGINIIEVENNAPLLHYEQVDSWEAFKPGFGIFKGRT
ncbi:hypothetical protein L5515_009966 [Caenorhabditis briggsae]|uniref:Uncharacterized protein n=1 Tax=Caenorhabditis briggsae TaxID=6238 RepID=A0AAE9JEG3_CAEBR|nr:hypothetical protein L5515_009966 [Caenorhabditis briggsae]